MKNFIYLFLIVFVSGCAQDKRMLQGETEFQREINAEYKDATKSPLKDKDRKTNSFNCRTIYQQVYFW